MILGMERTKISQTPKKIGQKVKVCGWVQTRRDHGKLIFVDLRDISGIVQVVFGSEAKDLGNEFVLEVFGEVVNRPKNLVNDKIETGKIELKAQEFKILGRSKSLPFPIDTDGHEIEEEVRLKYRYLDLRRTRLQKMIKVRSDLIRYAREFLFEKDFLEIETPILTKSTPEGSRDFIVPSRLQKGEFYALPQSPQQYKQLLMIAGFERYFQIARCLRDEDLRSDRTFEHTQIDLEMSFVQREDVMKLVEELAVFVFESLGARILAKPFPVFTYRDAVKKFGADKFDLRNDKEKRENFLAFAWIVDFPFFEKTPEGKWTYTHNPFSAPVPADEKKLIEGKIEGVLTSQYDLVCNGAEIGGGSIRSHDPKVLEKVFEVLGYKKEKIREKFGHMLEAFEYGAPPHGGIACGIERWLMTLTGERDIRETQAFPMTSRGRTSVMDAPSEVDETQLRELGIQIKKSK
jgi:aspartyl-tRNA synthetase